MADWKRVIVPNLTNNDPLKEEPTLMLMRDARCSLKHEKKAIYEIEDLKYRKKVLEITYFSFR